MREDGEARGDRIAKVLSYARTTSSEGVFPHNKTITEWYDWERFEAYRMLGFQEASTYLDRFDPYAPPQDGVRVGSDQAHEAELDWCKFADVGNKH